MPTLEEVATRIAAVNEAVHPHERDETPNALHPTREPETPHVGRRLMARPRGSLSTRRRMLALAGKTETLLEKVDELQNRPERF